MKYIITSKNEYLGTSTSDAANPLLVTEIATELIITRLYAIHLLNTNVINKDDTIVCINERSCLYSNIFNNVISYDHFKTLDITQNDIIDLLEKSLFNKLASGDINSRLLPYLPFYNNWERDKNEIVNIRKSILTDYDVSEPFICLVIRKRGAWTEKNMSDQFWIDVINKLESEGIRVFIFGKESEIFCTNKTTYIKNYQDWCTIVQETNCKHVASTMTGGVYPLLIFGNPLCKMTIIDNTNLMRRHGHDPSFYHSCINFSHIDISFINNIPTVENFCYELTKNL